MVEMADLKLLRYRMGMSLLRYQMEMSDLVGLASWQLQDSGCLSFV